MSATYEQKRAILEFYNPKTLNPLPHLHKELELIYVCEGGAQAIANRQVYDLRPGDVFLTFPYQVHYYLDAAQGDYILSCFPASTLLSLEGTVNSNELINNVIHIEPDSPEADFFQKMKNTRGPYSSAERCAYVTLIMAKLLPQLTLSPLKQSSNQTTKNILEYCSKHYTENLSLDILAKNLHLNKYYISHCINMQINMRLSTFINSLRVDAACKLLQETDKKVADIAQSVGYETIRSFNRAFMDIVGTSPKQYREKHMHGKKKQTLD